MYSEEKVYPRRVSVYFKANVDIEWEDKMEVR